MVVLPLLGASLLLRPVQKLPILLLVSEERNTGKTTFLNFLKALFQDNVTSSITSYHQHFSTVSRFWVSVPVLSEQTTLTAPSVSTEGSLRMMVCTLTILVTDRARQIVTTAGSPSGTAAALVVLT